MSDNRNGEIEFPFVEEIEIETAGNPIDRRKSLKGREVCYWSLKKFGYTSNEDAPLENLNKFPYLNSGIFMGTVYGIQKLIRRYIEVFDWTNEHDDQWIMLFL